jgi:hypothetical protein
VDPKAIGAIVFTCVFGGALVGMYLRSALPEHHLDNDSKDAVKLGMGLVATMAALVLGLLVASAKSAYDVRKAEIERIAADIILLDNALAHYGPAAQDARQRIRRNVAVGIDRLWPGEASQAPTASPATAAESGDLLSFLVGLTPGNDGQRGLQAVALRISTELLRQRWLLVAQEEEGDIIPVPFLVILIAWLAVVFASFGPFAPPNMTVAAMLFLSAFSVSGAVFLIVELAQPFSGLVQISSAPLRNLFTHLPQ